MASIRYLKNAPIAEAIIDIRAKLPKSFNIKQFDSLKKKLSERYPLFNEKKSIRSYQEIKNGQPVSPRIENLGIQGYLFRTSDKKEIVQFRRDGFTFNRLKPYTKWKDISVKAQELFPQYNKIATPETFTRLAVRYINRISIQLPIGDFSEYFTAPPKIPEKLPQNLLNFFKKVTIYDEAHEIAANIIHSFEGMPQLKNFIIVILDIDVFKIINNQLIEEKMWEEFEKLHDMKNEIFFNSITEKTAGLFE